MKKQQKLNFDKINQCIFEPSDNGYHLPEICKKCKKKKSTHLFINESHDAKAGKMDNYKLMLVGLKLYNYDKLIKILLKQEKTKKITNKKPKRKSKKHE